MRLKAIYCFIILLTIPLEYSTISAHAWSERDVWHDGRAPVYNWFADVPVLHLGDYWNYTVRARETNYDMDLSGFMNTTVVNITVHPTPRYYVRGVSHLEGSFKYLIFTIQVKVDVLSYTLISASNLAQISSTTKVVLSLDPDPLSLGGTTWYNLTFTPPPEEIDFPLAVGKVWNYSSEVNDGSSISYYNDTLQVTSILNRTVPAGEFTCAAIYSRASGTYRYYSPGARAVVESDVALSTGDVDLSAHLLLKEYSVGDDSNVAATPPPPYETLPSGVVSLALANLTGDEKYYLWGQVGEASPTLNITAPAGPDTSPSNTEFGSFGLIIYRNSVVLWAGSVVTHNYNVVAQNRTPLNLTMRENTTTTVMVELKNPSTENLSVDYTFKLDGSPLEVETAEVPAGSGISVSFALKNLSKGSHVLVFTADPGDAIQEINESDNTLIFHVVVMERPFIYIVNYVPEKKNVTIMEGEEVAFSVNLTTNDLENVTAEWFLSGTLVGEGLRYTFRTDYNSSVNSPYTVSFVASLPGSGNATINWTVTVVNVNRVPSLEVSPKKDTLNSTIGDNVKFRATAHDPDGETVEIRWYVNGTLSGTGGNFNFTAPGAGVYNITVEASDGKDSSSFTWTLYVHTPPKPPKPAAVVRRIPEERLIVLNESEDLVLSVMLEIGDWHLQRAKWYLEDEVVGEGVFNYTFRSAFTGQGSSRFSPYHVSFQALFEEGVLEENWTIIVLDVNRDPVILNVTVKIMNESGRDGRLLNLTAEAVDPDGDPLTFVWYVDGEMVMEGAMGSLYLPPGNHTITLNVSDGRGGRSIHVRVVHVPPAHGESRGEGEVPLLKEKRVSLYILLLIAVVVILFLYRTIAVSKPPGEEEYFE